MTTAAELSTQLATLQRAISEAAAREAEAARPVADLHSAMQEIEIALAGERRAPSGSEHIFRAVFEALRAIVAHVDALTVSAPSTSGETASTNDDA